LTFASKISSKKLEFINDNEFVFQESDEKDKKNFKLTRLMVMFSTYYLETMYQEKASEGESILHYALDSSAKVLIIVYKNLKLREEGERRFKFFDMEKNKTLISLDVTSKNLLGRFKMGGFNLIDGHMYFCNNVIKIRYDLLR
jgi:hypothetical protein